MCLRALAHRLRFVFGRTLCVDVTDYAAEALILARAQSGMPIILTGSADGERWEAIGAAARINRLSAQAHSPAYSRPGVDLGPVRAGGAADIGS